ncbi:putative DNA-binding domain-containing protein [Luteibacter aegosomatissinici]|uniref:HvfC/BufC family peptide modification chaperone n=1 Tax=Luteibacter aegosomatissinici TaxID=2911539 RepID=UPI001FFB6FE7|nr:putative DNA-binding domain-containing protein [Luteibacter aegosomatissinici]UPG96052.1 DNA-binding domain-containing protein [Luteibacter aegosomatissinici]
MSLAAFQRTFHAELRCEVPTSPLATHPGLAVHRSTMARAAIDALEANFPAVACLVGQAWFRSAAAAFFAEQPARDARLLAYGADFPAFLAAAPSASDLPYLADVAQLDWLWLESYAAADASALHASSVRRLADDAIGELRVAPHPATRAWSSSYPALAIWNASRACVAVPDDMAWEPQTALITRPAGDVVVTLADPPTLAFLDACTDEAPLAACVERTQHHFPSARTDLIFAQLLTTGALTAL